MAIRNRSTRIPNDAIPDRFDADRKEERPRAPVVEVVEIDDSGQEQSVEQNHEELSQLHDEPLEPQMEEVNEDLSVSGTISEEEVAEVPIEEAVNPIEHPQPVETVENEAAERIEAQVPPEQSEIEESTPQKQRQEVVEEIFRKRQPPVDFGLEQTRQDKGSQLIFWAIMVIVAAVVMGVGLLILTNTANSPAKITTTPTIVPEPATSTPTPTMVASVTRESLSIQVLNGGGVVGAGGKIKAFLEKKGYAVENVGNAEGFSFNTTEILVKTSVSPALDLLKEDLEEAYAIGTAAATLPESDLYDVRITVGKE